MATRRERDQSGKRIATHVRLVDLPDDENLVFLRDAAILSAAIYGHGETLPPIPNWQRVENIPQPRTVRGRLATPELTYGVWINETTRPATAMIVFRGTARPLDWYSNLRWVTALIPEVDDHYDQTIGVVPAIVQDIRQRYGANAVILAAGHSLGGGLAQTAAYAACGDIQIVFAFDSSPVTRHRTMRQCAPSGSAKAFYRVFEGSEALSYARFWLRLALGLRQENPHFVEVKVRLFNAFGVRAHNMSKLAIALDEARRAPSAAAGGM